MTLSSRSIKAIVAAGVLAILSAAGSTIWYYQSTIRTTLYTFLTPLFTKPVVTRVNPQTQITVKQTLVTNPIPVSPTPKPMTITKVEKVVVKQTNGTKPKINLLCKYDAYKDTPRCRK